MSISLHLGKCTVKIKAKDTLFEVLKHVCLYLSVSLDEGKRVVLRMQVKPGGQVNTQDPVIRVKMLAKVKNKISLMLMSVCCEMLHVLLSSIHNI